MAYVAVKGGQEAISKSIERLDYDRLKGASALNTSQIRSSMRALVDRCMSEASMYDEDMAALAIKQAEGDPEEAVFLLRAFRSTLQRKHYSRVVESKEMDIERRISAAFRDIPGGQILGSSRDYTHRLLDFDLVEEDDSEIRKFLESYVEKSGKNLSEDTLAAFEDQFKKGKLNLPNVMNFFMEEGIMGAKEDVNTEPGDITKTALKFPTTRSERLQVLTRGQTGAVTSLAYASLRGYGSVHPTVGELRVGTLPVYIDPPFENDYEGSDPREVSDAQDAYYIGEIRLTEVESLIPVTVQRADGSKEESFELGYGICYGQNETKAISMSILDRCLEQPSDAPSHDEEFVLYHIDSVESSGFISHLKLPHYVTFQAELDSVRKTRRHVEDDRA